MLKTGFKLLVGPLFLVASLVGVLHGVCAGVAQGLYYESRHGRFRGNTERIIYACEKADRLYPWNYLFCSAATDSAFLKADVTKGAVSKSLLLTAGKWCDVGLALNPYSRDLNLRKAGLMGAGEGNALKAAEYWARYTDWHYWNPENHCILGRMYAWAGEFDRAEACAMLITKSGYHAVLRATIDAEKVRQSNPRR